MNLHQGQTVTFKMKVNGKLTEFKGRVAFMDAWFAGHGRVVAYSATGKRVQFDTAHNLGLVRDFEAH